MDLLLFSLVKNSLWYTTSLQMNTFLRANLLYWVNDIRYICSSWYYYWIYFLRKSSYYIKKLYVMIFRYKHGWSTRDINSFIEEYIFCTSRLSIYMTSYNLNCGVRFYFSIRPQYTTLFGSMELCWFFLDISLNLPCKKLRNLLT